MSVSIVPARGRTSDSSSDFAMQSTPGHVAIIMDGNRRWARSRGLTASAGHRKGAQTLEALLPALARTSIGTLTLFGFSAANWQRPRVEVSQLMRLARTTLLRCAARCVSQNISVAVIGRRDRLPDALVDAIDSVERSTAGGGRHLRIAFDYSSRDAILTAARAGTPGDPCSFSEMLGGGDVDLLIRTGREQRLSDFLLWECAHAELYFPDVLWPDFDADQLEAALGWYATRVRRFGR